MNKYYILGITVACLTITGYLFFWFQIRPAEIRKECSAVEVHEDAKPADPGLTKEEAEVKKEQCEKENCSDGNGGGKICWPCASIQSKPATEAADAKDYSRQATEKEYEFCLHEKGLE